MFKKTKSMTAVTSSTGAQQIADVAIISIHVGATSSATLSYTIADETDVKNDAVPANQWVEIETIGADTSVMKFLDPAPTGFKVDVTGTADVHWRS